MGSSFEKEVKEGQTKNSGLIKRIDFGVMKYLWMANPLNKVRRNSIPRFLRNVELLKNFSDNELRILSKYMHSRKFNEKEVVFREGEVGIGFYFVFSGLIEIVHEQLDPETEELLMLDEFNYFGEMALLQEGSQRQATATAKKTSELIGIFKPDLERLIENHPLIAAKLIQSISQTLADRLSYVVEEFGKLRTACKKMEKQLADLLPEGKTEGLT